MSPIDIVVAVQKIGADEFMSITAFCSALGIVGYYLFKIWPKQEDGRKKLLEEHEKDRELLRETLMRQNVLLAKNTKAVETLDESLRILNMTFEKVSDKISSHDERSVYITQMLQSQTASINNINEKMASEEDINKLNEKINDLAKNMANKNDIMTIQDALQETESKIDVINMNVTKIKARIK